MFNLMDMQGAFKEFSEIFKKLVSLFVEIRDLLKEIKTIEEKNNELLEKLVGRE